MAYYAASVVSAFTKLAFGKLMCALISRFMVGMMVGFVFVVYTPNWIGTGYVVIVIAKHLVGTLKQYTLGSNAAWLRAFSSSRPSRNVLLSMAGFTQSGISSPSSPPKRIYTGKLIFAHCCSSGENIATALDWHSSYVFDFSCLFFNWQSACFALSFNNG